MRFLLTGGTGFIGRSLVHKLAQEGHAVTILTRRKEAGRTETGVAYIESNFEAGPDLSRAIESTDVIINLAGESVAARWTRFRKEQILESRLKATRALTQAIARAKKKPECLLSASAVGYYGSRGNEPLDEKSIAGLGFLADISRRWEEEACRAEDQGVRVVRVRIGVVLGRGGGALQKMLPPFRLGLGGPLGSGAQWMSWVHLSDLEDLMLWAAVNKSVQGPVNAAAPGAVRMKEFASTLGRVLGRPAFISVPAFAMRILAGEMSEMLLTGQKVLPKKALDAGFRFKFDSLEPALKEILG